MDFQSFVSKFVSSFPSMSGASSYSDEFFQTKYYSIESGTPWNELMAGQIYSFDYMITDKDLSSERVIDRRPLLMVLPTPSGYPKLKIFGLDLNLVSPPDRASFLSKLGGNLEMTFKDDKIVNPEEINSKLSKLNPRLIQMIGGPVIERSLKGFDVRYIPTFKRIDLEDWIKIPFLKNFKIQGSTANRIYNS